MSIMWFLNVFNIMQREEDIFVISVREMLALTVFYRLVQSLKESIFRKLAIYIHALMKVKAAENL